ncbi:hypothetical protein BKP35_10200 [Anaerobacillus arseniciselenatis]|uniref:Nucleotidyltransferase n=1 Tax=Anaerobacillus arseniciselenatis TaxID=85682 RepID=A0A1S2LKL4_9BACI|nr:nucleotidyltransferase domain-containing protein [Anaerobacillus arseniciselenatis]OIJ12926.1 hypothetical protein BKP35_10200 [Anaerobacillus arseniciselenatis]
MKTTILKHLSKIEADHDIRILYACEAGSRAYGLANENSDYDVRFIYIHRIDSYLSINKMEDVINAPISDLLDIHGWDFKKALHLFEKSNPSLLEWLHSPIIYIENSNVIDQLRELTKDTVSLRAVGYHYLHMAKRNYQQIDATNAKSYLNVLRPILVCLSIEKNRAFPLLDFQKHVVDICRDKEVEREVNELVKLKVRQEGRPNYQRLNVFIEQEIAFIEDIVKQLPAQTNDKMTHILNCIFKETLKSVWKLKF